MRSTASTTLISSTLFSAALIMVLIAGCGSEQGARAVVKGQVKFGDTPLTYGTVTFQAKDGRRGSGTIDATGNYSVPNAPIGETTVAVFVPPTPKMPVAKVQAPKGIAMKNPEGGPGMEGGTGGNPKAVQIPSKYGDPATSGLTHKVESGEQTHNITLPK